LLEVWEKVGVGLTGWQARSDALRARRPILRSRGTRQEKHESCQENTYTEKEGRKRPLLHGWFLVTNAHQIFFLPKGAMLRLYHRVQR
jgi:hypothetical protein